MNNSRRKRISKIADALNELKGQIDELYEEEQEAFENIPESLQGTERYEVAEKRSICSNLHPPASKMSSRSSETRRADLWDVAMFV